MGSPVPETEVPRARATATALDWENWSTLRPVTVTFLMKCYCQFPARAPPLEGPHETPGRESGAALRPTLV